MKLLVEKRISEGKICICTVFIRKEVAVESLRPAKLIVERSSEIVALSGKLRGEISEVGDLDY
jgi:hypothetical protein